MKFWIHGIKGTKLVSLRSTKLMNSPIAPRVFSSLRDPKAMAGRRQAKYRKIMVVMYFPIALLFPIIPGANHNKNHVGKALKTFSHQPQLLLVHLEKQKFSPHFKYVTKLWMFDSAQPTLFCSFGTKTATRHFWYHQNRKYKKPVAQFCHSAELGRASRQKL